MPIPAELEKLTVKQLADLAKKSGVAPLRGLRKDELISAIKKQIKAKSAAKSARKPKTPVKTPPKSSKTTAEKSKKTSKSTQKPTKTAPSKKSQQKSSVKKTATKKTTPSKSTSKEKQVAQEKKTTKVKPTTKPQVKPPVKTPAVAAKPTKPAKPVSKLVAQSAEDRAESDFRLANLKKSLLKYRELSGVFDGEHSDRLVLMARDSHWLHAFWELSAKLVDRAKAAMGAYWHTAAPILRLYRMTTDGISKQRRVHLRDIALQGNVNNWYIDVQDPPSCFVVEIGYVSSKGRFFPLASSNIVETPENHGSGRLEQPDGGWFDAANENDRIFRINGDRPGNYERKEGFEPQHKRAVTVPMISRFGGDPVETVKVDLEADVVIYGITQPDVQLTIKNEPIRLQPDGRFSVRFHLPEKRQVYPIVAVSCDGIESQTTILAIERNTKALETVYREHDELD